MGKSLSAGTASEMTQLGKASIVDLGSPSEFATGHPQRALSLPYSEKGLPDRLGLLLRSGTPVILMVNDPEQSRNAVAQLQGSSFPVIGVVDRNMSDWADSGLPIEVLPEISVKEIATTTSDTDELILDVREPIEWEMGHVPGALLISLGALEQRINEVPRNCRIAVICEAGVRSSSAASVLQAEGFVDVVNVIEGTGAYRNAGYPLEFTKE